MRRIKGVLLLLICIVLLSPSLAQHTNVYTEYTSKWNTIGPPKGTLMIIGGSASSANFTYFMKLVGDPNDLIVFIPTAGELYDESNKAYVDLVKAGARNIVILHTKDSLEANTEKFAVPLRQARAVFIAGGLQSRLAAAYRNTLTHQFLFELLERDGVVAGSSAGASIQGSYLYGGIPGGVGPQYNGLGFVKNSVIGQHYIRRNRMGSIARILKDNPSLFGFGVDEATAAIVRGNSLEVVGEGKVAIYNPKRKDYNTQFQEYLLHGDKYDLAARQVTYKARPIVDIELVKSSFWKKAYKSIHKGKGHKRGKLLLYGSVKIAPTSLQHFINSLSNKEKRIVVLSTGNDEMYLENSKIAVALYGLGAKQVDLLHTINSEEANSSSFTCVIDSAQAVWVCDSRSWQMVDAYLNTLVHEKLFRLLNRNGVLAGNGDGAAVLASRLFGEPEKYNWQKGFGFLDNTFVVNLSKNRSALRNAQQVIIDKPHILDVVLESNSVISINANKVKVESLQPIKIIRNTGKGSLQLLPGHTYKLKSLAFR